MSTSSSTSTYLSTLRDHAFALYCSGLCSPAIAQQLRVPERPIRSWIAAITAPAGQDLAAVVGALTGRPEGEGGGADIRISVTSAPAFAAESRFPAESATAPSPLPVGRGRGSSTLNRIGRGRFC